MGILWIFINSHYAPPHQHCWTGGIQSVAGGTSREHSHLTSRDGGGVP